MKILFISHGLTMDGVSVASALRAKGYSLDLLCFDATGVSDLGTPFSRVCTFDRSHKSLGIAWLLSSVLSAFFWTSVCTFVFRMLWTRYDAIYARSETNLWCVLGSWWFKQVRAVPLVYYPYDITSLREKKEDIPVLEGCAEKYLFRRADVLVHRMGAHQLSVLERVAGRLPERVVQLLPFPPRSMSPNLPPPHACHSPVRIVYIGGVALSDVTHHPDFVFDRLARILASMNAEFHVYPSPFGKSAVSQSDQVKELAVGCPELHLHESQNPTREFVASLAPYDYGWMADRRREQTDSPAFFATAFVTKVPVYLLAGLPVIVSANFEFMAQYVSRNNVGIVWETFDPDELSEKLRRADYAHLCDNVRRLRPRLVMEESIEPLTHCIEELTR